MSLFNQFTPVLFYSRTKLICGLVSSNNNADCKIVLDTSYDFKNLEKILTELKTNYGKFNWRILIANNLSYILKQDFLKTEIVSRTEVFQRAVNIIPENLDNDDWDYISLPSQSDGIQQVEIFAPVQEYWQNSKQILKKIEVYTKKLRNILKEINGRLDINGYEQNTQLSLSKKENFETMLNF